MDNEAALKRLPKRLRLQKLTGGRQLRLVGYDPGFEPSYATRSGDADDPRSPWAVIDIEDPRTGTRLGRLHYGPHGYPTAASSEQSIDDFLLVAAQAMARAAQASCPIDRSGQPQPLKKAPCSYPHLPPGTLVRVKRSRPIARLSPRTQTWDPREIEPWPSALGIAIGPTGKKRPAVLYPSHEFPSVLVLTERGAEEKPADWLEEVR